MTIKKLFICLFLATLVVLGLVFASIYQARNSSMALRKVQEMRYSSYLLADELRQSSDDLTRLARTYVVTGDAQYEQEYLDVIAVRSGKKPRPDGRTISLQDLMKQAGFTEEEFVKLKESEAKSNALVKIETAAMYAVKGLFDDGNGDFTRQGEPDPGLARTLMHDAQYHAEKASIMKPIDDFFALLDQRTAGQVQQAQAANSFWNGVAITAIVTALVLLLAALYWAFRLIIGQLGEEPQVVVKAVGRIAAGDLQTAIAVRPGDGTSLAHSLRTMQESLKGIVSDIQGMAEAAVERGDFGVKMETAGRKGFMKDISELLNSLSDVTESGLKDITRVSSALSGGDLSQTIERSYPGLFGQTAADVNRTAEVLSGLVAEIRHVADTASRGDFSQRIELSGKRGFGEDIGRLLNQLCGTTDVGLRDIIRVAQALARGDLTQRIERRHPGLFGEACNGINATVANLHRLIQQIKDNADQIGAATREIANGNQDLSVRTEKQAASLEETASSIEELTSTVKENESRVAQAGNIATSTSSIASHGGDTVKDSISTMNEIAQSSKQIADIIGVIDGIAFQTNILALNAAVEAARASEHGRGFAVVASEVRSLAQRSAEAAKDIKHLISDSVAKVDNGSERVNLVGDTMGGIVSGIRDVTTIMSEILAASREQTAGIDQVAQAIMQIDEVTQQNAALVEQVAAAAGSLNDRAEGLVQAVAAFNLGGSPAVERRDRDARSHGMLELVASA